VAITFEDTGLVANATATSLVFDKSSSFPLGEPDIGDLVVVAIERNGSNGAVTPNGAAATDWTERTDARAIGTATVKGTVHYYWRQWDGTEEDDYTWTFASSARRGVFYRFSTDVAFGVWRAVEAMTPYLGTNTTSTSFQFPNATGPFAAAVNAVVSSLVLSAGTGTTTPTNNQMTIVHGANVSQMSAYKVTSVTTALQPTWTWGAVTVRAKAAGALAAWTVVPPEEVNLSDSLGLSDSLTLSKFTDDPTRIFNRAKNLKIAHASNDGRQVKEVRLADATDHSNIVWSWLDPTPQVQFFDEPGGYYSFVVPDGVTELAFEGTGGRGGRGSAFGTTPSSGTADGGAGSKMIGTIQVQAGDIIEGYVAAKGGNGYDFVDPVNAPLGQCQGGEPGGAAPENNIFDHEDEDLGGCGGGLSSIWRTRAGVSVLMAMIAGGGGGGADAQTGGNGGRGGDGGGDEGQDGEDGTTNSTPATSGKGGKGGDQTNGGDGGLGSNLSNGSGDGDPGIEYAGGSTFRRGAFGSGLEPHPTGGGGGAGYRGGGGGGNGSVQSLAHGAAGGGAGGSDFQHPTEVEAISTQGGNPDDDGQLLFIYTAARD
jgi:hypothetical protein